MLTILEILIIVINIPVLIWALLPVKYVPRFLDFMPLSSVVFLVLHLFIDNEAVRLRFIPLYIFTVTVFLVTIVRIFKHNPDQPRRRVLAGAVRVFGSLGLTASVLVPTVLLPFYSLPEPTGDFSVSTVVCDFTDKNRIETLSKETGRYREIAVQFWYPADKKGANTQSDITGAQVSTSQQKYPLLIFSHGAFGMRKSNASTCRELASHGYIVASIDHTYHSFFTSFADGRGVPVNMSFMNEAIGVSNDKVPADKIFEITHDWLKLRTDDIEFLIDSRKAGRLRAEGELLNGHMDMTNIGLFGHSLGGAAAAQVCRERSDVKAAIVMDGTMIGDITGLDSNGKDIITKESFNKPLLLMYGSLYEKPEAKATSYLPNINAFNNSTDEAYALCINNSGHLNFTDLPRISPVLSRMLGVGTVDSLQCIKIVNAYSVAFFDQHIKGKASPLIDGKAGCKGTEFEKHIPVDMKPKGVI